MELALILLTISLLIFMFLYLKERKQNSELTKQLNDLKIENAQLKQQARFSDELKQILDGQIVEYLKQTNQNILSSAKDSIRDQLEKHQANIEKVIEPFRQIINRYDQAVREYFEKSAGKFGQLDQNLENLNKISQQLQQETSRLVEVFRNNRQRGAWGEFHLQKLLEIAGLQKHIDYIPQKTTSSGRRPDFIINLPDRRKIIIDVKTPLDDYLKYTESQDDKNRELYAQNYVKRIRSIFKDLSDKNYRATVENSFPYVILYIPLESAFILALSTDSSLYTDALAKKILITSPTTILPVLQMINLLWQQDEAARNIEKIISIASELRESYATMTDHFKKLGSSLDNSVKYYNNFINSWKSRVETKIRKLEQMGITSKSQLPELTPVEQNTKNLNHGNEQ